MKSIHPRSRRLAMLSTALVTALVFCALGAATAQAVWQKNGAPLSGEASFEVLGQLNIEAPSLGINFTSCQEKGSGTISSPYGVEEKVEITGCHPVGEPKECVVRPFEMLLTGAIGGLHSKESPLAMITTEGCNYFGEVFTLSEGSLKPSFGKASSHLSVSITGTSKWGSHPWTFSGESEWSSIFGESLGVGFPTYKWSLNTGKSGTGNGEFGNLIGGIAVEPSGDFWVVDGGNARVQKFNSNGEYLSQFGSLGTGNGQFSSPRGIARDASGNLWVSDSKLCRVQEFNSSGAYLRQFGSCGSGAGQLEKPEKLAIASDGTLWVADFGNHRVDHFSAEGKYLGQFGSQGTGNGQFERPYGVAIDPMGNLWVVDSVNFVQEFTSSGEFTRKVGSSGSGNGEFKNPFGIAADGEGNVWVADSGNRRIQGFNAQGEFIEKFGSSGSGNGQFGASVSGIAVDPKGGLWIGDTGNNRIQHWTF